MPKVTVVIPCYNDGRYVNDAVDSILNQTYKDFEIIIVDDGSTDKTGRTADEIAKRDGRVKVVHHTHNLGYGAALQSGFKTATKELVFYTDGDGQFDINEMPPLLSLMEQYDIVSCYRLNRRDPIIRKINGWCWTRLICLMFGLKIRDIDCAFKLYKREIFNKIELSSTGALIDAEILARAARKGYCIIQKGVHHYPRTAGAQSGANLRVILRAFKELLKLQRRIRSGN